MDPIVMEGWIGGGVNREESDGQFVGAAYKEMFADSSPRSPLYTHSPAETDSFDLAMDGVMDTSIEQLYNNVYEMQSSDHSPSRRSFLSYGEESRIDSELRYLAGVDYGEVEEIKKEVVLEDKGVGGGGIVSDREKAACEDEKFGKMNNNNNKPNSPAKVNRKPNPRSSKSFHGRTPFTRKMSSSSTNLRKLNTPQSMRKGGEDPGKGKPTYLGPYLLKQARALVSSGDNYEKALDLALRAIKSFEVCSKPNSSNLEFVMCLHVAAALYCRLGRYREAIPVLERSIEIPVMDKGQNHALAKFAGCMQLGDTYAMQGQIENSILFYTAGLEIQRQVLGEKDSRLGETCRYVAEAHIQAMQFDEAEKLCQMALEIHRQNGRPGSFEEAADRRLLGLVYDSKGDYEAALEHYVLASMALAAQGQEAEVAAIECNIGDAYLALARYDEAICSYQRALTTFKTIKGESHPSVASVFVRLADLYFRIGKFKESKSYCENALRVYAKPAPGPKTQPDEIASGLVDVSAIYESMDEPEQALNLLQKAIKAYGDAPGQQSTIAGIEAQIGVLYYILGEYSDSYTSLKSAIDKFRAIGEKKSALLGIALNQMGLTCIQLYAINEAADLFEGYEGEGLGKMVGKLIFLGLVFINLGLGVHCAAPRRPVDVPFSTNYVPTWAADHIKYINGGRSVDLVLDRNTGTGFQSKNSYQFGHFSMRMKLVGGDSAGVVTAFYLSSNNAEHDEIDFEFLGNRTGQPYILQTNVFTGGKGNREQRIYLWFDPTKGFHSYSVLWNMYCIVFFVDDVPIRIFKNSKDLGLRFPFNQPMKLYSSLWNADDWATRGGLEKTDWSKAPFIASYTSFHVDGCMASTPQEVQVCNTVGKRWWDQKAFQDLDAEQYRRLRWVRQKYTVYNYCYDKARYPTVPIECAKYRDI